MMRQFACLIGVVCVLQAAHAGPLFDAAEQGDVAAVKELLENGAPVENRGRDDATALIASALNGNYEVAEILVEAGAGIMARNSGGYTALHAAAYGGHTDIVRLLLDHGAVLDDRQNRAGQTPLYMAAEENRIETAKLLLAEGADPMAVGSHGFSILTQTWAKKRMEMVALLKQHGATCQPAGILGSEEYYRSCVAAGQ